MLIIPMMSYKAVFFYSTSSKIHAEQIATDLKKITNKNLKDRIGSGLEVEKRVSFFIHNIN